MPDPSPGQLPHQPRHDRHHKRPYCNRVRVSFVSQYCYEGGLVDDTKQLLTKFADAVETIYKWHFQQLLAASLVEGRFATATPLNLPRGAASAAKTCVPLARPPIVDVLVCVACADSINQDNPKASSIECTPAAAAVLLPPALVKVTVEPGIIRASSIAACVLQLSWPPPPPLTPKSTVRRLPLPQSDTSWSDRGIAAPIAGVGSAHGLRVCCGDVDLRGRPSRSPPHDMFVQQVVALAEVQALDEQPCVFVVLKMHERTIGLQTPREVVLGVVVESDPTPRTDLLDVHHDLIMLEFHHTVTAPALMRSRSMPNTANFMSSNEQKWRVKYLSALKLPSTAVAVAVDEKTAALPSLSVLNNIPRHSKASSALSPSVRSVRPRKMSSEPIGIPAQQLSQSLSNVQHLDWRRLESSERYQRNLNQYELDDHRGNHEVRWTTSDEYDG
ncbi:hypothetical protein DYB28_005830 [Aphanomyces astaci]|uniref:Uncharacterized protein n=1 Tax=Aphanomyces astaci TaxID=112090 RepID=A0A9X8H5A3_APHAT|nr:hypothetical protein DYB28_005830 [Aphanomyces astaci]